MRIRMKGAKTEVIFSRMAQFDGFRNQINDVDARFNFVDRIQEVSMTFPVRLKKTAQHRRGTNFREAGKIEMRQIEEIHPNPTTNIIDQ